MSMSRCERGLSCLCLRSLTSPSYPAHSDSVIYFQITNPYRAAFGISDLRQALVERAQTTLRHVVGARAVQSVVTEREAIAFEIAEIVGDVADKWGVAIEGILIKDIIGTKDKMQTTRKYSYLSFTWAILTQNFSWFLCPSWG